jgi:hypothetical protein
MVQSVLANLKSDELIWSGEPEIVSEVSAIQSEFDQVNEDLEHVSGLDPTGHTKSKNSVVDTTLKATFKLCRRMCIYARKQNDLALLNFADHSENSLSAGTEKEVINRCAAIVSKAQSMANILSPYKVTAEGLAEIRQLIETYEKHIETRSTVKTDKSVSIQDISGQIGSLKNRLDLLDDMIEGLIEDEEMIARYQMARMVINYGAGKTLKNKGDKDAPSQAN